VKDRRAILVVAGLGGAAALAALAGRKKLVQKQGLPPCPDESQTRIYDPDTEEAAFLFVRFERTGKFSQELQDKIGYQLRDIAPHLPIVEPVTRLTGPPTFKLGEGDDIQSFFVIDAIYPKGHPTFARAGSGFEVEGNDRSELLGALFAASPEFAQIADVGAIKYLKPYTAVKPCANVFNAKFHTRMRLVIGTDVEIGGIEKWVWPVSRMAKEVEKFAGSITRRMTQDLGSSAPWLIGKPQISVADNGNYKISVSFYMVAPKDSKPADITSSNVGKYLRSAVEQIDPDIKGRLRNFTVVRAKG
jgi:hypothetical protein